jgi:hypothetical protein
MFNRNTIADKFFGIVGFDNPTISKYAIVSTSNQLSRSGRKATDSPYCKIPQLFETIEDADTDTAQFNEFLTKLQKQSITDVIDKVLINPAFIDRQMLYQNVSRKVDTEVLPAGFVGYRIRTSRENNVAFEITRCFFEFEGSGEIELLLFSTQSDEPLFRKTITIDSKTVQEPLNWKIDSTGNYFKGDFYLGYLTKDVTVLPFSRSYQNARIKSNIAHLELTACEVQGVEVAEMFDIDTVRWSTECYGLNFDISVYYDYTDLIIQNERLFAPAIQLQMVINSIQHLLATSRSNRAEIIGREQINLLVAQLEGVDGSIEGLMPTLKKELFGLNKQIDKLIKGYFATGFTLNTLR